MSKWKTAIPWILVCVFLAWLAASRFGPGRPVQFTSGDPSTLSPHQVQVRTVVWTEPEPLLPFETKRSVLGPAFSPDRSLLVCALREPGGDSDLFISRKEGEVWSELEPLGVLNSEADEIGPAFTRDGRALLFASQRPGGEGGYDLWVSVKSENGSWQAPKNLGSRVNSTFDELDPAPSADGQFIYYSSTAPSRNAQVKSQTGDRDIRVAPLEPDFTAGYGRPVPGLNSSADDSEPVVSDFGHFIYFSSNRAGGRGGFDLYRARLVEGGAESPENLGFPVNTAANETGPELWPDGLNIAFSSDADFADRMSLYRASSREIVTAPGPHPWFELLQRHLWLILLCVLSFGLTWWLLRRYFGQNASLGEKCLAGSVVVHLLLLFLFGSWKFAGEVIALKKKDTIEVSLSSDNLSEEKLALDIRESVASLPPVQVNSAPAFESPAPPPLEAPNRPDLPPMAQPNQAPVDMEFAVPQPRVRPGPVEPVLDDPVLPKVVVTHEAPDPVDVTVPDLQLEARPEPPPVQARAPLAEIPPSPAPNPPPRAEPDPAPDRSPMPRNLSLKASALPPAEANAVPEAPTIMETAPPPAAIPKTANPALEGEALTAMNTAPVAEAIQLEVPDPGTLEATEELPETPVLPAVAARMGPDPEPTELPEDAVAPTRALEPPAVVVETSSAATLMPPQNSVNPLLELPESSALLAVADLELADTLALEAPLQVKDPYMLRDPDTRKKVIEQLGGSDETEKAIEAALNWFSRQQRPDGHWDIARTGGRKNHRMASTSFALLSYMGWGATHQSKTRYRNHVSKGLDWLLDQVKEDGDARGEGGDMYDQGLATITLAEAYGLTKDPKLHDKLVAAVRFIVEAQSDRSGGWRYQPGDHNADTSVVGWQVLALNRARHAGIETPDSAFRGAARWLDHVGGGKHRGLYGYQDRRPKAAMVAEGMFCQQLIGLPPGNPRMEESVAYLQEHLPSAGSVNYYYWYYAALALFQHGGPVWEEWNAALKPILLESQVRKGGNAGSWDPKGPYGDDAGRIGVTAMATLTLEVYYRYLPMYDRK